MVWSTAGEDVRSLPPRRRGGGMADAAVSKTAGGNPVWVRLPPSAPAIRIRGGREALQNGQLVRRAGCPRTDPDARTGWAADRTLTDVVVGCSFVPGAVA